MLIIIKTKIKLYETGAKDAIKIPPEKANNRKNKISDLCKTFMMYKYQITGFYSIYKTFFI